jgi:hypothetical protein
MAIPEVPRLKRPEERERFGRNIRMKATFRRHEIPGQSRLTLVLKKGLNKQLEKC